MKIVCNCKNDSHPADAANQLTPKHFPASHVLISSFLHIFCAVPTNQVLGFQIHTHSASYCMISLYQTFKLITAVANVVFYISAFVNAGFSGMQIPI